MGFDNNYSRVSTGKLSMVICQEEMVYHSKTPKNVPDFNLKFPKPFFENKWKSFASFDFQQRVRERRQIKLIKY